MDRGGRIGGRGQRKRGREVRVSSTMLWVGVHKPL